MVSTYIIYKTKKDHNETVTFLTYHFVKCLNFSSFEFYSIGNLIWLSLLQEFKS